MTLIAENKVEGELASRDLDRTSKLRLVIAGLFGVSFFACHLIYTCVNGKTVEVLWSCHLA